MTYKSVGLGLCLLAAAASGCVGERAAEHELVVSAAASLTDALREIGPLFEASGSGVAIQLNLGGSLTLREQILNGAPVDVFASADQANMRRVAKAGLLAEPARVFARNRLQIAVPVGNPAGVEGLTDLARAELLIGLCAPEVPCGELARELLADAGVAAAPDSLEPSVRSLLTKLEAGELDVGLVYASDVAASDAVEGVETVHESPLTEYPVAVLARSTDNPAATAFVDFLLSVEARAVLAKHGFLTDD